LLAKSYIVDKVESTENIIIRTKKDKGKFGRILGELIVDNTNLNEAMINKHLGVAYYGQSKEDIEAEHLKNKEILINNNAYQPVI
jgi:endonuclease YncB( thermonuclease family)